MDEIHKKIINHLYNVNAFHGHIEILNFIKTIITDDNTAKAYLEYLSQEQYAEFGGHNKLDGLPNYLWRYDVLGNPHPVLRTIHSLNIMTTLTGKLKDKGISYVREEQKHSENKKIAIDGVTLARNGLLSGIIAFVFSAVAILLSLWLPQIEVQTKWIITGGVLACLVIGILSLLRLYNKLNKYD